MLKRYPITIFGATGYTGKLICHELEKYHTPYAIAGRNLESLTHLQTLLPSKPAILIADVFNSNSLLHMTSQSKVVLSCVGPYIKFGKQVQDACLETKTHFLDITGELSYMIETFKRNQEAKDKSIAMVNAVGFDVVATEIASALACENMEGNISLRVAFTVKGAGLSRGTMKSILLNLSRKAHAYEYGKLILEPLAEHEWRIFFPGKSKPTITYSFPLGDIIATPHATGSKTIRTYLSIPKSLRFLLRSPLTNILRNKKINRWLVDKIHSMKEGPSLEDRNNSSFSVVAEASNENEKTKRVAYTIALNGYDFTASTAAACAFWMSQPEFTKSGVMASTKAFGIDKIVALLKKKGLRFE